MKASSGWLLQPRLLQDSLLASGGGGSHEPSLADRRFPHVAHLQGFPFVSISVSTVPSLLGSWAWMRIHTHDLNVTWSLCKHPISKEGLVPRYWGWGFQCNYFRDIFRIITVSLPTWSPERLVFKIQFQVVLSAAVLALTCANSWDWNTQTPVPTHTGDAWRCSALTDFRAQLSPNPRLCSAPPLLGLLPLCSAQVPSTPRQQAGWPCPRSSSSASSHAGAPASGAFWFLLRWDRGEAATGKTTSEGSKVLLTQWGGTGWEKGGGFTCPDLEII